ncbi:MAG: hypothetical protein V7784_03970 [Oceanospirillaceae bacterium]
MDKLSNEGITDNEEHKSIKVTSEEISSISIAGRDFRIAENTDLDVSIKPRRCHVLCLSNKGNSSELFELFEADICIAINVVEMVAMIKSANDHLGFEIISGDITYYRSSIELLACKSVEEGAFLKPVEPYQKESEYRIAVFWPKDESSEIYTREVGYKSVFDHSATKDDHITFNFQCPEFNQIVVGVQRI